MEVKAKAKHIRMSPRKVRLVADVVRGMEVNVALDQLQMNSKWAKKPIKKLIESAISNAQNNFELDRDNLFIKEIRVDEGATLKRWMPRAHGRATPLRKRTSHIMVTLGEVKDSGEKKAKKQKIEAPVKLDGKLEEEKEAKSKKNLSKKRDDKKGAEKELGKDIVDPRGEGKGKHTKIEGGQGKGFASKVFRRKSG